MINWTHEEILDLVAYIQGSLDKAPILDQLFDSDAPEIIRGYLSEIKSAKAFDFKDKKFSCSELYKKYRRSSFDSETHLLFELPLRELPLNINNKFPLNYIARWRLKMGK